MLYAFGHLGWFLDTPLGQVPVLDQREFISLAHAMADNSLPAEPFYRAPGYAAFLAIFLLLGTPAEQLFRAALLLGALLHALNAWLCARAAREWVSDESAVPAGLLYALNPVLVHFALQANDATLGLTCFLAGLGALGAATKEARPRPKAWLAASLAWALATVVRPNYLLGWLAVPALAALRTRSLRITAGALAGVVVFAGLGLWQLAVSGTFGFLPAQGPYNLWASNQPGAHGRYYTQKLALPPELAAQNPARAESLLLYERETGRTADDLATANRHWRARLVREVTDNPGRWLQLMGRKAYALLNTWEQYNNETPAFHLARSPWLRWNPLSWGLLLILGVAGLARLADTRRSNLMPFAALLLVTALAAWLTFVSARFRLPLVALLSLPAGAVVARPLFWRAWPWRRRLALLLAVTLAGGVTYSRLDDVDSDATFVQDHALLARAAEEVGDDALAWNHATAALRWQPNHPDALRLATTSYFNLLLYGSAPTEHEKRWREAASQVAVQPGTPADVRVIAGIAWWRAGQRGRAIESWRSFDSQPVALAARYLAGDLAPDVNTMRRWPGEAWQQPLVRLAAAQSGLGPLAGEQAQVRAVTERIFGLHPEQEATHQL